MTAVDDGNFEQWNEAMCIKYDPDIQHNHPNPIMRYIENKRTRSVFDLLDVKDCDAVLDIGCGCGNMLDKIARGALYGVDISRFAIEQATKRLKDRAVLYNCNAESLPFEDSTFDKIFCSEVIEHTLHPERIIKEIFRVLKSGGICVISIPNEKFSRYIKSFLRALGISRFFLPGDKSDGDKLYGIHEWHLHCFGLNKLKSLITDVFMITAQEAIPFGFIPIKYVVRLRKTVV